MAGTAEHKISAVLIAVLDLFFFGLGFGRVLQLAHARSWGLDLRKSVVVDQARYAEVLAALVAGVFLFVLQTKELRGDAAVDRLRARHRLAGAAALASSSGRRACCSTTASPARDRRPRRTSSPWSGWSGCG